ncbi:Homocysteine-responsive endoplasmic reticulum-resident ubiquitin-like domain member 2 protein [Bulinus truncatus]|nr:Homocysteine-responsive endoplasmic reticulum-resident ubiquitin-like domain member 2 protein [Bulinus truncatus]
MSSEQKKIAAQSLVSLQSTLMSAKDNIKTDSMDLSSDMPVTLTIKAPNQRMEDQTVDCMLGWTIKKLKQHLEKVYPSKPRHNEQRLIYSGRLLQDHLTLKEILRQYEGSELPNNRHTVHLVCSSSSESFSASDSKAADESSLPQASSSNSNNFIKEATPATYGEGLRHRGAPNHGDNLNLRSQTQGSAQQTNAHQQPVVNLTPEFPYSPEQYAWMMQNYAYTQYMMQYMQYYQSAYYSGLPYNSQMFPNSFVQQPSTNVDIQSQAQQPQGMAAAAAAAGGQAQRANVRMNAQGGVDEEDEDEGEPRDWLHHVYFFMRFLTFMGILFFYSNLTRFLVVFTGSLAVFLLQRMRKYWQRDQPQVQQRPQQEQQRPQQVQQQPQQEQQQQQEGSSPQQNSDQGNQNGDSSEAEGELRGEGQEGSTEPEQQSEQPANDGTRLSRVLIFIGSTIQSFFTSLLPTPPELLEAN